MRNTSDNKICVSCCCCCVVRAERMHADTNPEEAGVEKGDTGSDIDRRQHQLLLTATRVRYLRHVCVAGTSAGAPLLSSLSVAGSGHLPALLLHVLTRHTPGLACEWPHVHMSHLGTQILLGGKNGAEPSENRTAVLLQYVASTYKSTW